MGIAKSCVKGNEEESWEKGYERWLAEHQIGEADTWPM